MFANYPLTRDVCWSKCNQAQTKPTNLLCFKLQKLQLEAMSIVFEADCSRVDSRGYDTRQIPVVGGVVSTRIIWPVDKCVLQADQFLLEIVKSIAHLVEVSKSIEILKTCIRIHFRFEVFSFVTICSIVAFVIDCWKCVLDSIDSYWGSCFNPFILIAEKLTFLDSR